MLTRVSANGPDRGILDFVFKVGAQRFSYVASVGERCDHPGVGDIRQSDISIYAGLFLSSLADQDLSSRAGWDLSSLADRNVIILANRYSTGFAKRTATKIDSLKPPV